MPNALVVACLIASALPSVAAAAAPRYVEPATPAAAVGHREAFGIGARVGLGGVLRSEGLDGEGVLPMLAAELDLRFERGSWFGDLSLGLMVDPDDDRYGALTLTGAANLYLGEGALAPYLGGGVGLRLDSAPETAKLSMGFGGQVGAGVVLDRDADTRWFADVRLAVHFVSPDADYTGRSAPSYVRLELLAGAGASF